MSGGLPERVISRFLSLSSSAADFTTTSCMAISAVR